MPPSGDSPKPSKSTWGGIIVFLQSWIHNGTIEAISGLIQLAERMARGFRCFRYRSIGAFLKAGKLRLDLPALPT
ncbi:transposase [Methylacidimicrobium sp. B4]|uniref:transposase n=1 Tax=Methylacidimicrobium sp. B4 TaxID=2796139 RepID=UPI001F5D1C2A|nr:transposase [Methylacidimicrobium sp. B4]